MSGSKGTTPDYSIALISEPKTNQSLYVEKYSGLIYTGDIRDIKNLFSKEFIEELEIKEILNKIDLLESNSTSTFLCECDKNEYSWIYLPSQDIKPHRMIMTGNFSITNNRK